MYVTHTSLNYSDGFAQQVRSIDTDFLRILTALFEQVMSYRITFNGLADRNVRVKCDPALNSAYGFAKDFTSGCDVRRSSRGIHMSWQKKKALLHNPVNFSDWFQNIENFMVGVILSAYDF